MEARKAYWYTIIKYIADFTKGEPLNVGIILEPHEHSEENTQYVLLEDNNLKLKSIFETKLQQTTYKYGKEYFEYFMSKIHDGTYPTDLDLKNSSLLSNLTSSVELPKGFFLSEPQFAKTSKPNELFYNLEVSYIGSKFINQVTGSRELIVKDRASLIFSDADLINKKVKTNIKLNPSPSIPFKYQIDFAYRTKDKIDLVQAAPGNIDLLPGWLEKMNLFSTRYDKANKITLLYDSSVDFELLHDTKAIIELLKSNIDIVSSVDINNKQNGIQTFINEIKTNATDVAQLEELIA